MRRRLSPMLMVNAALLAGCSGSGPPAPQRAQMKASEAAVRAIGTDFAACATTDLTARAESGCVDGAVRGLARLRFPVQLDVLVAQATTAGQKSAACFAHVDVQHLDACAAAQAHFIAELTNVEYSLALLPSPSPGFAPDYWSLAPLPSLQPDAGDEFLFDSLDPPGLGWVRNANAVVHADGTYHILAARGLEYLAFVPRGAPTVSFDISADMQFGNASTIAGVACRGTGTTRYTFRVTGHGASDLVARASPDSPGRRLDADPGIGSLRSPTHVSAACFTLSDDGRHTTNRLLLFVDGRLAIDVVDTWPGETGRAWRGALYVEGFRGDGDAAFSNLTERDFGS